MIIHHFQSLVMREDYATTHRRQKFQSLLNSGEVQNKRWKWTKIKISKNHLSFLNILAEKICIINKFVLHHKYENQGNGGKLFNRRRRVNHVNSQYKFIQKKPTVVKHEV